MKRNLYNLFFMVLLSLDLIFISSCSTVSYESIYPTLKDGRYDSEFPYRASSEELESISHSVKRINSTCFFKTYIFNPSDRVTINGIRKKELDDLAIETGYADQSSAGTGTIIFSARGKVVLLTCAHVVNYPDTVISFVPDATGNPTEFIESILLKTDQSSKLEILAIDEKKDIAIIGRNYHSFTNYIFNPITYPIGNAEELEWGSFVYIFSYPLNYQMITKALVSSPNYDDDGSFILDAVINKGSSGGIVLAIKDGVPNFEIVGMIQWAPVDENNVIAPEKRKTDEPYNTIVPYNGKLYVKRNIDIKYGIAKVISMNSIIKFLDEKRALLNEKGFYLQKFSN